MRLAWQLVQRSKNSVTVPKFGATWEVLATETGVSRRTLAYLIAWLREHGLLVVVTPGSTVRYRKGTVYGLLDDGRGNEAAVYALTVPADLVDEPEPSGAEEVPWPVETVKERPMFSQVNGPVESPCTPAPSSGYSPARTIPNPGARESARTKPARVWSAAATPGTKVERLLACEQMRLDDPLLRRLTARHLRSVFRPLFEVGATINDVKWVLERHLDGTGALPGNGVRWLPGWLSWRVREWVDEEGRLRADLPSQACRKAAERDRERIGAWSAHRRMLAAQAGDRSRGLARVRAALDEVRKGA